MTERVPIAEIVRCDDYRVFTLAETRTLFPLVQRLTRHSHAELEPVRQRLSRLLPGHPDLAGVERQYEAIVRHWAGTMQRLGLLVRGLWQVDFDTGDGYLCWRFPQLRIGHYYAYGEDYDSRRPIDEVVEETDPDWAHG